MKLVWVFLFTLVLNTNLFASNLQGVADSLSKLTPALRDRIIETMPKDRKAEISRILGITIDNEDTADSEQLLAKLFREKMAFFNEETKTLTIGNESGCATASGNGLTVSVRGIGLNTAGCKNSILHAQTTLILDGVPRPINLYIKGVESIQRAQAID